MTRTSEQPGLFDPKIVFEGVVKFFHSGSGDDLRWCATRHDIGLGVDGSMVLVNHKRSADVMTRESAEAFFGPERDPGRAALRKIFPFIPKD